MKLVVKIGGAFLEKSQNDFWIKELISLYEEGHQIIVVHGAGPFISRAFEELGLTPKFLGGQRVTSSDEVSIVEDVLTNQINRQLVDLFQFHGAKAFGFSGVDGKILQCSPLNPELGQVGKVEHIRGNVLAELSAQGIVILSPVGIDPSGRTKYNVNADVAAAAVAKATEATLIFLTGEKGLLDQDGAVMAKVNCKQVQAMIEDGSILGGMIVKAEMIMDVLTKSEQVCILNAQSEGNLTGFVREARVDGTLFVK